MASAKIYPSIIPGKRFGRLTVIEEAPPRVSKEGWKRRHWRCQCDCGAYRDVLQGHLNLGLTTSCGCLRRERFAEFRENQTEKSLRDILGNRRRFGRLLVAETGLDAEARPRQYRVLCMCDCGNSTTVAVYSLLKGISRSCGCLRTEELVDRSVTHGQAGPLRRTPEYRAWSSAKSRCYNPNVRNYDEYGGRGIRMCDRWLNSFEAFFADMGPRPSSGHSIDRIDNDGNYEPGNCRWAVKEVQLRNTRSNRRIQFKGAEFTLVEASEMFGLKRATIAKRLDDGWPVEKALLTPVRKSIRWHST